MNLPHASQWQIEAMKKKAEEQFGATEEPIVEPQEVPVEEPEVEEPQPEQPEQQPEEQPEQQPEQQQQKSSKEDNMRILRERSEKAERERDELIRQLQQQAENPQSEVKNLAEEVEELSLNPDDLAEGKHLLQLAKKIKNLEAKLDKSSEKAQMTTTEMKIKRDFPDFDKVANYDNLTKLREFDADLADAILATKDVYRQHALAYKMVKKMGIYREDTYGKDRELAQRNTAKPRPLTSISPHQGDSPLSKANAFANGLTDELRQQLRHEMAEAMKKS